MPNSPGSDLSLIPITAKLSTIYPAGYAAPAHISLESESTDLATVAEAVLSDPISLLKLCDRVAELMAQDLRLQRDRSGNSGDYHYGRG